MLKTQQEQQLNDMIYFISELSNILKDNIETDQKTTDSLNRLVMDCYMNYHPNNNPRSGRDRFKQYNKLADSFSNSLEKYSESKNKTEKSLKNLRELIEQLEKIKLSLH